MPVIFLRGNLSDGFAACGPYPTMNDAAWDHDNDEGWLMTLEEPSEAMKKVWEEVKDAPVSKEP